MNELREGLRLNRIVTRSGVEYESSAGCSLVVVMQPGQNGLVPWVRIDGPGGTELVNCDSVERLEVAPGELDR